MARHGPRRPRAWLPGAPGTLLAFVLSLPLAGCADRAAAVPDDAVRVLPAPSGEVTPRADPWPAGWPERFCPALSAVNDITYRLRDVAVIIGKGEAAIRRASGDLADAGSDAVAALRRVPAWRKAQPLMDLYTEVATSARDLGTVLRQLLANPTPAVYRRAVGVAKRYDRAALQLAIKQGRLLNPLNVDCT
jgi:hypothetical protein